MARTPKPVAAEPVTTEELLGELTHQFAVLIRCELQLSLAERDPGQRDAAGQLLVEAMAALFALGALNTAAVVGIGSHLTYWAAALIVGGAWALIATLAVRFDVVERLRRRLTEKRFADSIERARRDQVDAEAAVKVTAGRLGEAVAREAAQHEREVIVDAAKRVEAAAVNDVERLIKELVAALLAPGRAGIGVLERIVGR